MGEQISSFTYLFLFNYGILCEKTRSLVIHKGANSGPWAMFSISEHLMEIYLPVIKPQKVTKTPTISLYK